MKRISLFAGVVVAVLLSMAVRSQEADAVIEPLLKDPVAEPAAPVPAVVEAPVAEAVVPAPEPAAVEAPVAEAVVPPPAPEPAAVEAPVAEAVAPPAEPVAEGASVESAAVAVVPAAEDTVVERAAGIVERPDGLISVNLDEIPMSEVVKLFAQVSGVNIVAATSNLNGTVSASLKDVKWQPAFESILSRHDLLLTEKPAGSGIFVIESGRAGAEPHVTETIILRYAKVDRMATLINTMLGKEGRATAFADGNAILVQAPASRIAEIRQVVEKLDTSRGQVYIEARFVEMSAAASKKLGLKWDSLNDWGVTATGLKAGAIGTTGRLGQYRTGGVTYIDHDGDPGGVETALRPQQEIMTTDKLTGTVGMEAEDVAWKRFAGIQGQLSANDFRLAMSAFEKEDGVSMISNPKIIVANEETAVVDMTTKEPYVKVTANRNTSTGGNTLDITTELGVIPGKNEPFVGEAFFSYGVSVKVQPRVSSSGVISIVIEPSISSKTGTYVIEGAEDMPTTEYPIINMKKITTTFSMLDGSTAVIGGLTISEENNIDSGIPLLRNIPWVGPRLFGWKSRAKGQREIIIFVTVGIVNPEQVMPENVGLPKNAVLSRGFQEPSDRPKEELMRLKE